MAEPQDPSRGCAYQPHGRGRFNGPDRSGVGGRHRAPEPLEEPSASEAAGTSLTKVLPDLAATPPPPTSPPPASADKPKKRRRVPVWAFVAPSLIVLAVIILYPLGRAIWMSMHSDGKKLDPETGMFVTGQFTWFDNYKNWITQSCNTANGSIPCPPGTLGSQFWQSIGNTFGFTVVTVSARDGDRSVDGADHGQDVPRPRSAARFGADSLGHPHRRHREALVLHLRQRRHRQQASSAPTSCGRRIPGRHDSRSSSPTSGRPRRSWRC